jgi:predicted ATPase
MHEQTQQQRNALQDNDDDDEIPELQEMVSQLDGIDLDENDEVEPCPITLLTGFLGSGKTTLLECVASEMDA